MVTVYNPKARSPRRVKATVLNSRVFLALPVAAVVGIAPVNPTLALRSGAVVCAIALLCSLPRLRIRAADVYMLAYALIVVASNYWTIDAAATSLSTKNVLAAAAIFLAVRAVSMDWAGWSLVGTFLVGGCSYAAYRIFFDNGIENARFSFDVTGTRYAIENVNANYLAYSLVTGMIFAFVLVVRLGKRRYWLALLVALLLLYAGTIQAGTRGALVGAALALAWVVVTHLIKPTTAHSLRVLLAGLFVLALSIVTGLFQSVAQPFVVATSREQGDLNGRFSVWPIAREWWWEHFWFGSGAGTFVEANYAHIAAHNFVLDIGTGVGLVGVALVFAVMFSCLWRETKTLPRRVMIVGAYCLASAPLLLAGFWIESPVFWAGMGLIGVAGASWPESAGVLVKPALPRTRVSAIASSGVALNSEGCS